MKSCIGPRLVGWFRNGPRNRSAVRLSLEPHTRPLPTGSPRCVERRDLADVVDKATRGRMMAGIRGKHTKPEILVRKALFAAGYRFRLHRRDLPGAPDVALPGRKIAIFVHGCFWHRHTCRAGRSLPSIRSEFWSTKLARNVERDKVTQKQLRRLGWTVVVVWECQLKQHAIDSAVSRVLRALKH